MKMEEKNAQEIRENKNVISDEALEKVTGGDGENDDFVFENPGVSAVDVWTCSVCGYKIRSRYQDLSQYCPNAANKIDKLFGIKHKAKWQ